MNINDLITMLLDAEQELGGTAEVRLAVQPSWPFEHRIGNDLVIHDDVVYLAEAGQIDYLPGTVAEELGWR